MIRTEGMLSVLVAEYAQKTEQRRKIDAESKRLATDIAALDEKLVEAFAQAGIQNIKTKTGQTVYLNREVFAKLIGDHKKALTAFRRAGLADFVKETVNANTLRAYVREMDEVLPKGLQPYVDITEVFRMRMRSS
jgi:response regulator RpfG family c-di-GMP phosphodiesterase